MSISLTRQTANALFDIQLRADAETGEFNAHPYYVSTLAVLERLGCVEPTDRPDCWRLTTFGRTTGVSIPENRKERLAAQDDARGEHDR